MASGAWLALYGAVPRLRVLFASSECVPFAKTGGLGDVTGALPVELSRRGHVVPGSLRTSVQELRRAEDLMVEVQVQVEASSTLEDASRLLSERDHLLPSVPRQRNPNR